MAEFRLAIKINPKRAEGHNHLGSCLRQQTRYDEAMAEFRRAIELAPKGAEGHNNLGMCWQAKGQLDEAMAEYRLAIDLNPKESAAHYNLGACLLDKSRLDEAMAEFRLSIALNPKGAAAHKALGLALLKQGRFTEAKAATRACLDLLASRDPLRKSATHQLGQCEGMITLDAHLPAFLQGKEPLNAGEQLKLARICKDFGRPHAAVRLFDLAFAARPALAADLLSRNRYDAACAAVRAAADSGPDGAQLDKSARAKLRRKALDWLWADLTLRAKLPRGGTVVIAPLTTWQTDVALLGVRDEARLAQLPLEERREWQHLWADVDVLLAGGDPEGRAHAARREWSKAADCYARALKFDPPEDGKVWFEYAAVLLLAGDRQGYAKVCARMVEKCGKTPPQVLRPYHVARACTLAPGAVADAALPGRLARKELTDNAREFWSLTEQGALLYRASRFQEAVALLEKSLKADPKSGRSVLNWLWLAMAHHRLDNPEEARQWLDKAQVWLDRFGDGMPDRAEELLGLHLHNWLEAHILRREAEALLGGGPAQPK
jgi:tetratricopeptide (TPR) repeat protein